MSPHPLFEPEFFEPENWRRSSIDPFAKYVHNPANWTKAPHPWFDGTRYLATMPAARRHPAGPLGHFCATARADTPLPLAIPLSGERTFTWHAARQQLLRSLRTRREQERLRLTGRISARYDRGRERRFLARWSRAALPPTEPGRPLVSVVVPVWNRAELVAAAIRSVLAQTLTSWELLVVDDGSTDGSTAVVESFAARDPRIRLLPQPHAGVSRARNLALEHAVGHYVAFLDSDNTYRPHFLRTAVAAMHGHAWRVAYAAMEMHNGAKVQYRALGAGRELLDLRNHIDLNVVVADRGLVDEVGRFDERLRRTVDYDLILRMDAVDPVRYMPFVGAVYDHNGDDPNRITNSEPNSWLEVVQNSRFVDWEAQATTRVPGRVSVLVPTYEDWRLTKACVAALLAEAGHDDLEIVVLDNASRRSVWSLLTAICATDPRIRLVREPLNRNFALGCNLAFARSTGETVVFLNNDTEVQGGWLAPLRRLLDDPSVLAAQPLLLYPDGSVQCAGVAFPPRATFPVHFLAHHPAEDARRVGRSFNISAVTGAALAMRAGDVVALRGFDPIYRNGWEDVDLCLRLGQLRPGTLAVSTESVVLHHEGKTAGRSKHTPANRQIFRQRWARQLPRSDEHLWRAAGFDVAHYAVDRSPGIARAEIARPVLTRPRSDVETGPAAGLPAFRWALKIASPAGKPGLAWGDLHFARALASALERLGQEVVIDSRGAQHRDSAYLDDVVLVLRGLASVAPQPGRVNLMWVISHPDLVSAEEARTYDAVFAAGAPWAARMSDQLGQPVGTLLQCTDPTLFHPDVAAPDSGEPVLFIGNSRNVFRPIVRDALSAGVEVGIYGTRWERFVDHRFIRGEYLPNECVAAAYRSAGVLLNDHWDDMRREGFVSNRVFDATAAGARVVSDDVPGLKEMFGGLVLTYRTEAELKELLTRPRDEVFPSGTERRALAEQVHREHSFDARARALLDAVVRIWGD